MDIYLVGGAVRDKLLSLPVKDRDWVVVGADVETMLALGYQQVGKDFPVFIHPQSKEEYALARTERKTGPGHTGFKLNAAPDVTLEEDLQRRDLTINAMAEDSQGQVTDPCHGRDDLQQRILRHVSPAFAEDPLRVLRVARFAARFHCLGFTIADETRALMQDISRSGELQALPPERIWQETQLALTEQDPGIFFSTLVDCGALSTIFPGLTMSRFNLAALAAATKLSKSPAVRFAALCCELSLSVFLELCQQLRTPNEFRDLGKLLLSFTASNLADALADTPRQQIDQQAEKLLGILELTDALRRPKNLDDFFLVLEAVQQAQGKRDFSRTRRLLTTALQLARTITAEDIIEAGHEGAAIGREMTQQRLQAIRHFLAQEIKHE